MKTERFAAIRNARVFCCFKNRHNSDTDTLSNESYIELNNAKGYFLEQVWRQGIPPKFRKKIWPFVI